MIFPEMFVVDVRCMCSLKENEQHRRAETRARRVCRLDAPVLLQEQQEAMCAHVATFEATFSSAKDVLTVGDVLPLRLVLTSALVEPLRLSRVDVSFRDDRYCLVLHASSAGPLEAGAVGSGAHVVEHETLELLPNQPSVFHVEVRCFTITVGRAGRLEHAAGPSGPKPGRPAFLCVAMHRW